jgi:flagellar hook-length control protein FliK
MNLVKVPERENSDIMSLKSGNDFFAMVLEKTGYEEKQKRSENKTDQFNELRDSGFKSDYSRTDRKSDAAQNDVKQTGTVKDRDDHKADPVKDNTHADEAVKNEAKGDLKDKPENEESVKTSVDSPKEITNGKESDEESDEEAGVIDQLNDKVNIKTLLDIIKAAFDGDKKGEDENFQKLTDNLKFKKDKEKSQLTSFLKKNDIDKDTKTNPERSESFMKDLKELLNRELSKGSENRRVSTKPQPLSEKELKELASNIIEGMKKNKAKEIVKHEARIASGEEIKNYKKLSLTPFEDQSSKKIVLTDDTSSEKNGAKDKNTGKESFSYNGGKFELSSKSGLDRVLHNGKMPDFKENLQEIIDKAKVTVRDGRNGTFTVRLNPQELGNVNVNLVMENGVITGKFLVDNEDVKSLLLSNLNDLKLQMEEAGIAVGEFSVNVDDQREKYLKQKDDEELRALLYPKSDKEVIAAAEQYNSNSAAHTGHINMVI